MILKQPLVIDISHWKIVSSFALLDPRPALIITKATEATGYVDNTFSTYYPAIRQNNYARGCFHFFRKAYDALAQAQHFCNTIRAYVVDDDILVLDFEEGGETAAQLLTFTEYVDSQYPNNLVMVYSRKNLMDPIAMTSTQAAKMKRYPVWVAGYPANPDLYNSVPAFYVPDQTRWGPVRLWQYTDNGSIKGITGGVDSNWIHPILFETLKNSTPPPPTNGGPVTIKNIITGTTSETTRLFATPKGVEINTIPAGTAIEGDATSGAAVYNDQWIHIYKPQAGWVNKASVPNWKWTTITIQDPPPPDPTPDPSTITGVRFSGEVVFDFANGTQDVWHVTDIPFIKGPVV